jgi:hypothetical protein
MRIQDNNEKCVWFRTGTPEIHFQLTNELIE